MLFETRFGPFFTRVRPDARGSVRPGPIGTGVLENQNDEERYGIIYKFWAIRGWIQRVNRAYLILAVLDIKGTAATLVLFVRGRGATRALSGNGSMRSIRRDADIEVDCGATTTGADALRCPSTPVLLLVSGGCILTRVVVDAVVGGSGAWEWEPDAAGGASRSRTTRTRIGRSG